MGVRQTTKGPVAVKYVAAIEEDTYLIGIGATGEVTVSDLPREVNLEAIDGSHFALVIGAKAYDVFLESDAERTAVTVDGERYEVQVTDEHPARPSEAVKSPLGRRVGGGRQSAGASAGNSPTGAQPSGGRTPGAVTCPMTGVMVQVLVHDGQEVQGGEGVAVLEAMKTTSVLRAPCKGIVKNVQVTVGQAVRMDHVIMSIDSSES